MIMITSVDVFWSVSWYNLFIFEHERININGHITSLGHAEGSNKTVLVSGV